ncbi:Regulatory protein AfsR [Streptomyces sp. enrichment culture]|uniref:AfsR/SARP family transcriptional regulator n=1 Tax=Streptomyces sp. MD20-1-1 TaxID=3028668 RepID=UPI0029B487C7|nr:BTAD domain-containing putative transcriptional regulator [Streptomyces sp. MD20-1-1]WTC15588.1 NB-ARC domain-containing protein [Streptomyces cellulosae]
MLTVTLNPIEFRLLGPVKVTRSGSSVPLSGAKIHTVLATLLLSRGRVVSDVRLSSMLWGHTPPDTLNAQIYTYVSRLRKRLGVSVDIARQGPGYVLNAPDGQVDLFEFERLHTRGQQVLQQRKYREASKLLSEALALWNGDPLENVTEHLLDAERPRLESLWASALEHRMEADLALGGHRRIVPELTGLVRQFPLNETLRAQLVTALHRSARQADAVNVYREGRRILREQLGVEPGPALQAAYRTMLRGEAGAVPADADAVPVEAPAMLPPRTAAFTGRAADVARLRSLIVPTDGTPANQPRTALITGMAGSGKTSLAIQIAHACAREFPDGLLYADLGDADGRPKGSADILRGLLRALGESGPSGDAEGAAELDDLIRLYRTRTAGQRLLIVLDNAVGDVRVAPLLTGGPGVATLITSRTRLASLTAAHTVPLNPLAEDEALALFSALVGQARAAAEPEATRAVVRHCAGLPLALRIAGTRLASRPHWSVARLVERLADPLTRLDELRYGDLDVRRTFMRSLPQLHSLTRKVLPWLSMLGDGPFSALTAGDALGLPEAQAERVLEDLVDTSLIEVSAAGDGGDDRYRFHPLVFLFAESLPQRTSGDLRSTRAARRGPADAVRRIARV